MYEDQLRFIMMHEYSIGSITMYEDQVGPSGCRIHFSLLDSSRPQNTRTMSIENVGDNHGRDHDHYYNEQNHHFHNDHQDDQAYDEDYLHDIMIISTRCRFV
jgi:hypothetical protein